MSSKKRQNLERAIRLAPWKSKRHASALRANLSLYAKRIRPSLKPHPLAVPGQAFDSYFLQESRLFRKSRELYLKQNGTHDPRLVTSPRSLASTILLENRIQYTPSEDELLWHATDQGEKSNAEGLLRLTTYSTSLFHEQSHRILWKELPPPSDLSRDGIGRYLNFIESAVIGLDMALGDELGPKRSALGYLTGVLYDPGSYASFKTRRERRNYLQVAIRSTYLALEGYGVARVRKALPRWMPECEPRAADHAIQRAFRLDDLFIYVTNPEWQKKNFKTVEKFLRKASRKTRATFHLSESADDWIAPYLAVEKIFDRFGI